MLNDMATLQCPNNLCKAPNRQTDKFCQQCSTPLIKRYLWAVSDGISTYKLGDMVAERYLLKSNRIFLDTKPSLLPETPYSEISKNIIPYLRLVSYRLQIPQVYGLVPSREGRTATEILLLEQAPIYTDAVQLLEGQLMPELTSAWKDASSMRQLNWLWQMAHLWQPLSTEGVASSLLDPQLLRVEGSLVRLLQLQLDRTCAPALPQLGQLWSQLIAKARPSIAGFLEQLCLSLIQGSVQTAEQLIAVLDRGLAEVGRSQARTLSIGTCTDTGPSRQRNEDACYPPSGNIIIKPPDSKALVIVCDGIGGHEGGDVASNLAIETIQQQVQQIPLDDPNLDAKTLSDELERSAFAANDSISQRNDNENRHGRQRMGTTLVMVLARAHEIYIANVGDSRAYWITPTGCHQVTLDDDVASREVRLGYALYRDALQQPSSGSLVQALGMSPSLHPTVGRFILDADCVFLLCSDGLSDYDLVDLCWEQEISPILDGKVDLATASQRLVEIANTENGHDNVTVGLVYCQVSSFEPESTVSASLVLHSITVPSDSASPTAKTTVVDTNNLGIPPNASLSTLQTQLLPSEPAPRRFFVSVLLGFVLLLSLGGGLLGAYFSIPEVSRRVNRLIGLTPSPTVLPEPPTSSPSAEPSVPKETPAVRLEEGSLIQIQNQINLGEIGESQKPSAIAPNQQLPIVRFKGSVPASSILKVVDRSNQDDFLKLRICSIPNTGSFEIAKPKPGLNQTKPSGRNVEPSPTASNSKRVGTNSAVLKQGEEGWIREITIILDVPKNVEPSQVDDCPFHFNP